MEVCSQKLSFYSNNFTTESFCICVDAALYISVNDRYV